MENVSWASEEVNSYEKEQPSGKEQGCVCVCWERGMELVRDGNKLKWWFVPQM